MTFSADNAPRHSYAQPNVLHVAASDGARLAFEKAGGQVFEDIQFHVFADDHQNVGYSEAFFWRRKDHTPDAKQFTMHDVMEQIRAPEAWKFTRGHGATIAIIDTGIAGALREISAQRRSPVDLPTQFARRHWLDPKPHGTMCAAIAAGSRADGGRYDGVAPEATVLSARTALTTTDIFDAYDEILRARDTGALTGPLVISNSYGQLSCVTPGVLPLAHPFMANITAAIDRDIFVSFAAGNNHYDVCKHSPTACGPNTIWGPNSHDSVFSVGTVNRASSNRDVATPHVSSSRGPGEWAELTTKPDCVAPTYGEVAWGTGYRAMNWWGTSGACPQVAGTAALMLSVNPQLTPAEIGETIRKTCRVLPEAKTCVGHGVLDCCAAVEAAQNLRQPVDST